MTKAALFGAVAKKVWVPPPFFDFPAFFSGRNGAAMCGVPGYSQYFTDSAGTTPVTHQQDPVARATDVSGNLNHFLQTVSSNKGVMRKYLDLNNYQVSPIGNRNVKYLTTGMTSYGPGGWLESGFETGTDDFTIVAMIPRLLYNNSTAFIYMRPEPFTNESSTPTIGVRTDYVGSGSGYDMVRGWMGNSDAIITNYADGIRQWLTVELEVKTDGASGTDMVLRVTSNIKDDPVSQTFNYPAIPMMNRRLLTAISTGFSTIPFTMGIEGSLSVGERATLLNGLYDLFQRWL